MNPRQHGSVSHARRQGGFALVLVLATLVLLLVLAMAFFSRAELHRQTSASSTANRQTEILVDSVVDLLVGDLVHEIAAGSMPTNPSSPVYLPRMIDTPQTWLGSSVRISTAPSMSPQRVVGNSTTPPSLLKQSLTSRPFFQTGSGYDNANLPSIPSRASSLNTADDTQKNGRLAPARWNLPALASSSQTIPAPDWIYLNRSGQTPTTFNATWIDKKPDNPDFVIGRFAYNIYDVGGLIDINTVGNLLPADENARRGRLHQVSLADAPADLRISNFPDFLQWRSPSDTDPSETPGGGGLFDPKRDFSRVPAGSQAFVSRQELIRFASRPNSPIPPSALPHLTTFSRALNAPSHIPEPNRPKLPNAPPADDMNPSFAAIRFPGNTTLTRGSDPDLTVPAGTPIMPRRFPLSKIQLLSDNQTDADSLRYYFGLQKQGDTFRYIEDAGGRIKQLREVAAEGREPNFFEVLQAAIITGSLGRDSGNVYTLNQPYDSNRYYQVLQIGANIIDQWDTDDYPTSIEFPMGNAGEFHTVHGIENLPYFNNISFNAYRPQGEPDRFQIWALFDVWNPHRNSNQAPRDIQRFRIVPKGEAKAELRFMAPPTRPSGMSTTANYTLFNNATAYAPAAWQNLTTLNSGREISISADTFPMPVIVGGGTRPVGNGDTYFGGALVVDYQAVPPAVPEATLETLPSGNRRMFMQDALNFSFAGLKPTKWGRKAHNWFRLESHPLESRKMSFSLEYLPQGSSGGWRTYHTVHAILPQSTDAPSTADTIGLMAGSEVVFQARPFNSKAEVELETYNQPSDETICFYGWRNSTVRLPGFSMSRFDPRTSRFGMNGNSGDPLGKTIRESAGNYAGSSSSTQFNWRLWSSYFVVGKDTSIDVFGDKGIEWLMISPTATNPPAPAFGFIQNIPDLPIGNSNPGRYKDRDEVIRPADGYLGAIPTVRGTTGPIVDDRPVMLNRPFRSVAEMGYAFRDLPWKTLDFFTKNSGDLALLDAFSVDETDSFPAVVTSRMNPNSATEETLTAILQGSQTLSSNLTAAESRTIARAIIDAKQQGPFVNIGDLVSRALTPKSSTDPGPLSQIRKTERESAIRTLAAIGQTRTWNLLLDLVVQTGRFGLQSQSTADFLPKSERRYWVHLALDRFTGELVAKHMERVDE
jgi:hypothetical protein